MPHTFTFWIRTLEFGGFGLEAFVPRVEDCFLSLFFMKTALTPGIFSQRYRSKPSAGLLPIYQRCEFAGCSAGCSNPEKPLLLHTSISRHILLTPRFERFSNMLGFYSQLSLRVTEFLCPQTKCWADRGNGTFLRFQQITRLGQKGK